MKRSFDWPQIAAFRLARHHLLEQNQAEDRLRVNLVTVCQNVCGIQAQVMAAAELALWARTRGLVRAEVHAALYQSRTLVKTSCMRQTLHLIPAGDFSIYINALKRSRSAALRRIMSRFGITPQETATLNHRVVEALGSGAKTQPELLQHIMTRAGKKLRAYLELTWSIQAFRPALVEGLICYGPERGKKATFVCADRWLPPQRAIDEEQAKQVLLRRYLKAYAPATLQDFCRWSGIAVLEARPIWQALKNELREIDVAGRQASVLDEDFLQLANGAKAGQSVNLLPHFDSYLLGHVEKDHLVHPNYYQRVYRNQGWISPVVLLNGRAIGVWSYARQAHRWALAIEPFEKFSKGVQAKIAAEAARLGDFLGVSWTIEFRARQAVRSGRS